MQTRILHRPNSRGFTLIELMIAVIILAVLLGLSVPSFQNAALNSQLRASANGLVSSSFYARSESFKRNAVVTLCVSSDGTTCGTGGWEQGWIVAVGATVLERHAAAPTGFRITAAGGSTSLQFQPTGAGSTSDTLTICRATPSPGTSQRIVVIDAAGRAMVSHATGSTCS
jgi:type IV fimbrial biogenesis protein FimT